MENEYSDHVYSKQDIFKAFDMGLEWGIYVFEKAAGLTPEGQIQLIERLKKVLSEDTKPDIQQPKNVLRLL